MDDARFRETTQRPLRQKEIVLVILDDEHHWPDTHVAAGS
jgi:hypothetical protein